MTDTGIQQQIQPVRRIMRHLLNNQGNEKQNGLWFQDGFSTQYARLDQSFTIVDFHPFARQYPVPGNEMEAGSPVEKPPGRRASAPPGDAGSPDKLDQAAEGDQKQHIQVEHSRSSGEYQPGLMDVATSFQHISRLVNELGGIQVQQETIACATNGGEDVGREAGEASTEQKQRVDRSHSTDVFNEIGMLVESLNRSPAAAPETPAETPPETSLETAGSKRIERSRLLTKLTRLLYSNPAVRPTGGAEAGDSPAIHRETAGEKYFSGQRRKNTPASASVQPQGQPQDAAGVSAGADKTMQMLQGVLEQDLPGRNNTGTVPPAGVQTDIGGAEPQRVADALNEYLQEQAGLHGVDLS